MEINKVHCGDAVKLLGDIGHRPNLIIMSPPDLSETSFTLDEYKDFLKESYGKASAALDDNGVLVSITTDRKLKGEIYTKHIDIIERTPLKLFNYKIHAKSLKANLYILNYCHMLFFKNNKSKKIVNNKIKSFYPDVWVLEVDKVKGYKTKDSFPTELIKRIVLNFSNENDLILDPFIGTGKTAVVCKQNNRNYMGFDIDQGIVDIANKNINNNIS